MQEFVYFYTKKERRSAPSVSRRRSVSVAVCALSGRRPVRRLAVLLVVQLTADHPEVRLHGLLAVRGVLLREESRLIGGDVRQVILALQHHRSDCAELVTDVHLFGRDGC